MNTSAPIKPYVENVDEDRAYRLFFRMLILVFVLVFLGVCLLSVLSYTKAARLKSEGVAVEASVMTCCDVDRGGIPGVAGDVVIDAPSGAQVMVHVPFAQRADASDTAYAYYTEHHTLPILFDPRDPTHVALNFPNDTSNVAVLRTAIIRPLAVAVIEGVILLLMMSFRVATPGSAGAMGRKTERAG